MSPRWNVSTEVQIGGHRDIRYTGEDISWYGAMSGPTLNQSHSSTYVSNIVTPPISLPLPLPAPMIHAIFLMAVCISDQDGKLELKEDVMMMGGQSDDSLSLTMWQPTCHSLLGPAVFEGERDSKVLLFVFASPRFCCLHPTCLVATWCPLTLQTTTLYSSFLAAVI